MRRSGSVRGTLVAMLALALGIGLASVAPASLASVLSEGVVISEFRSGGPSGEDDEFVEIMNTSANPVDISGFRLQGCASSGEAVFDRAVVPDGTVLQPGQHFLFTGDGYSEPVPADLTYSTGFAGFADTNSSGVRLVYSSGAVVDGVGSPNSPCRESAGIGLSGDDSFERQSAGRRDTGDNAADFGTREAAHPQNSRRSPSTQVPALTSLPAPSTEG